MRRRWRILLILLVALAGGGYVAWRNQSIIIGRIAEFYLRHTTDPARKQAVVAGLSRALLLEPPPDALVPELFDVVTVASRRVASGEMSFDWLAHCYTTYERDLLAQRPSGMPRRSLDEVQAEMDRYTAFYAIQKRPDARGVTIQDFLGTGDDVITLEEIEEAARTGKEIDLRTRGLH